MTLGADALDGVLRGAGSSLAETFSELARWNLYTGLRADPALAYVDGARYLELTERAIESELEARLVRLLPLSARYYALAVREAEAVQAVAELTADAPELSLMAAIERDGRIVRLEHSVSGAGRTVAVEALAGDTLHVMLVNGRHQGESLRPNLCIGTRAAVTVCLENLRGVDAARDAGTVLADDDAGPTEPPREAAAQDGGSTPVRDAGWRGERDGERNAIGRQSWTLP